MWTNTGALFKYRSPSHPEFTFYYKPLPKYEQRRLRREYNQYFNTEEFMSDLLKKRLLVIQEQARHSTYCYEWPQDRAAQSHLLARLPEGLIIELGAAILGWMRGIDEDATHFMERVVGDLKEALA